jgi:hypothetical protein
MPKYLKSKIKKNEKNKFGYISDIKMDTFLILRTLDKYFIPDITNLILEYSAKGLWDYKLPRREIDEETHFISFSDFLGNKKERMLSG